MSYDTQFYDLIKPGCINSAGSVVPYIMRTFYPEHVVDVGCGEGWWLSIFKKFGCKITGFDGDYIQRDRLSIPPESFHPIDLAHERVPEHYHNKFDLAISLEVAEHLPKERGDTFVEDLCSLSKVVIFSAAIPGQGGMNHINEQWPIYWTNLFERLEYRVSGAFRYEFLTNPNVEPWYSQNMLVCVHKDLLADGNRAYLKYFNLDRHFIYPHSFVHPKIFESKL